MKTNVIQFSIASTLCVIYSMYAVNQARGIDSAIGNGIEMLIFILIYIAVLGAAIYMRQIRTEKSYFSSIFTSLIVFIIPALICDQYLRFVFQS